MESLPTINSEPLHNHHPWNSQCSEPGDFSLGNNGAWAFQRSPLVGSLLDEFILSRAIRLVTSLNIMDSQKEDLSLPGMWVYLYLGFMVLCSLMIGSFIVLLHWRKYLGRKRCAQQWVEAVKASSFMYSPHVYWVNKMRYYGIEAAITTGLPPDIAKNEIKVEIPDSPWELHTPEGRSSSPTAEVPGPMQAPVVVLQQPASNRMPQRQSRSSFPILIFQAVPFDGPLHHIPPMLERSASYPLDICPKKKICLHAVPRRALV